MKKKRRERPCLWGGVSGAVTLEMGSEEEVREAVRTVMDTLGPQGFILSPVDNVRVDSDLTRKNVEALIDEWRSPSPVA